MMAVEWLGEYMNTYRGTVVLISHDRWFFRPRGDAYYRD